MSIRSIKNDYVYCVIGGCLFAFAFNVFIVPLKLYSGGIIGIAQIIRTCLTTYLNLDFGQFDIAGIINFIMNIPLFILAYRSISRRFFIKTLLCVGSQTIAFSLVMIPKAPIINDALAACLIAGLIGGFGVGLTLRSGGSGGGLDILGIYFIQKFSNFSVGRLNLLINIFVFSVSAILFNVTIAIYSIIFTSCAYLVVDKTHYQNINMTAMIFTKSEDVKEEIIKEMRRGITYWSGAGAYTKEETQILVTVISKYEVAQIKRIIYKTDPNAFVIFNEGMSISGNFEKRL